MTEFVTDRFGIRHIGAPQRAAPRSLYTADTPARTGRVLSRAEALTLGQDLLNLVRDAAWGVCIEHTARSITGVSRNQLRGWNIGDEIAVWFTSRVGSGWPVFITTNEVAPERLKQIVGDAMKLRPPPPRLEDSDIDDPDSQMRFIVNPREFLPVSLWNDETATALDAPAADAMGPVIDEMKREGLNGSATAALTARSLLYLYQPGLTAFCRETDCELTVTARADEDTVSGWSGQANRDWKAISSTTVAQAAAESAKKARHPVALEPGRRTVILAPTAVAQLVRFMADHFAAGMTNIGETVFSAPPGSGRRNLVGQRVCDSRLRFVSDPADPLGGFPPFHEAEGNGVAGFPLPVMTWIDGGYLRNLAYTLMDGPGHILCERPYSVRVEPMPGVQTHTIEEMIAACDDGVYITRFSGIDQVNRRANLLSGVTRDGCWYIQHGKITKPIKNFRFLEVPIHAFARLQMIGTPVRAALGQDSPLEMERYAGLISRGRWSRWPRSPVIAPPMMIGDFNLHALADAV